MSKQTAAPGAGPRGGTMSARSLRTDVKIGRISFSHDWGVWHMPTGTLLFSAPTRDECESYSESEGGDA